MVRETLKNITKYTGLGAIIKNKCNILSIQRKELNTANGTVSVEDRENIS